MVEGDRKRGGRAATEGRGKSVRDQRKGRVYKKQGGNRKTITERGG